MRKSKLLEEHHVSQDLSNLLIGAAVGSVIGAATALLFAPESGKALRSDIYDTCHDVGEKAQDFAKQAIDMGHKAYDMTNDYAETARNHYFPSQKKSGINRHLVIGALGGTLLGVAAYLISTKSDDEEEIRSMAGKIKLAGKTAKESLTSIDWIETAKEAIQALSHKLHGEEEESSERYEKASAGGPDLINWAVFGLKLLQNVKRRR